MPLDRHGRDMTGAINGPKHTDSCFVPCGSYSAPWLCVYTKPQAEREAFQQLSQQRFPAYLPLHVVPDDRLKRVQPLFPRYLFAQPFQGSWSAIRGTRGVTDVLRTPYGTAREVPPNALERLWVQCSRDGVIYPPEPVRIGPGDALRITTGPFAEFAGICSRTKGDRIWILMGAMMGGEREVEVDRDALEAA